MSFEVSQILFLIPEMVSSVFLENMLTVWFIKIPMLTGKF